MHSSPFPTETLESIPTASASKYRLPPGIEPNEDFDRFISIAEAHNLPEDDVQALLALASNCMRRGAEAALTAQSQAWDKTRAGWVLELKSDPEIGNENFAASHTLALRTAQEFGGEGLTAVFNSGWGDNPAMFKFCLAIGKRLALKPQSDATAEVS